MFDLEEKLSNLKENRILMKQISNKGAVIFKNQLIQSQ